MNSLLYFIAFYIIRVILVGNKRKICSRKIKWFVRVMIGLTLINGLFGCLLTNITLLIILGLLYIFYLVELKRVEIAESVSEVDDSILD